MKTTSSLALAAGIALGLLESRGHSAESPGSSEAQGIELNDGAKLTLLGVTHGTHHVPPHYETLRTVNWIDTHEDATVAWVAAEHDPKRWPSYELLVSDKANTGCVNVEKRSGSHVKDGLDIQSFVLRAFPRWEPETILRARPVGGGPIAKGQFVIGNLESGPLPAWTPEPIPTTQSDGDFEVTLKNVIAGVPLPRRPEQPAPVNDPANQCVRINYEFRQNGLAVTNWRSGLVRTSDPAGNTVTSHISEYPQDGIYVYPKPGSPYPALKTDGYFYRPGLWPGVSAWKLRLEFTRTSGFEPGEILTLTNLPVRQGTQQEADDEWTWDESQTNFNFTAASVNGFHVKVLPPLLVPDKFQAGQEHISVIIYADPNPKSQEMRLTVLEATDEQGQNVWTPFSPDWAGHFSLDFPNPRHTSTLNLKLALHKSRFVEFTVKPQVNR